MWHVTVATAGRWVWFKPKEAQQHALRAIARVGRERLLLFALGDDHAHLVLRGDRGAVAQRAGDIVRSLRHLPDCGELQPCHFKAVEGRGHLENLLAYLVRQPEHHGHAATDWPGTCLSDLIGARALEGYSIAPLATELPRRDLAAEALRAAKIVGPLRPCSDEQLASTEPEELWAAVGAALLPLDFRELRSAVRTYAALAERAGVDVEHSLRVTGVPYRSWRRYVVHPLEPRHVDVALRSVALRRRFRTVPPTR